MSETITEAVQKKEGKPKKGSASTIVIIAVAVVAVLALVFYFVDPFAVFHPIPPIDDENLKGSWQVTMTIDDDGASYNGATRPSENSQSLTMKLDFPNRSATFEWGDDLIVTPFERTEGKNDFHLDYSAYEGAFHMKCDGEITAVGNTYTIQNGTFLVEYKGDITQTYTGKFVAVLND